MDDSLHKWLSFSETNDHNNLFNEFNMNSPEKETEGENSVHPEETSWKNHSSYSCHFTESTTLLRNNIGINSTSLEEGNTTAFDHTTSFKPHDCPKSMPYFLSFEDSTSVSNLPDIMEIPHKGKSLKRDRTSSQTYDHIMAERKRRENITRMFIALSALIPGLRKTDKATILTNAIDYVKFLQQRVKDLEQEKDKRKMESLGYIKMNNINVGDNISWTSDGIDVDRPRKICPKVEAKVSGKDVLITVMCGKQKDIVRKLLTKLEGRKLSIVSTNVLPFGNSALNITSIAKMDYEFNMTSDDLVKMLTEDLLECCNSQ